MAPGKGATFIVQFPNVSGIKLPNYFGRRTANMAAGKIQHGSDVPHWTAQTVDGLQVEICELNATPTSTQTSGTSGFSIHSSVSAEVTYASVNLSKDNQLSFWHQTPTQARMLSLGFTSSAWHIRDEVTYERDGVTYTTERGIIELSKSPRILLVTAGQMNLPSAVNTCWLVTEQSSVAKEHPNRTEQGFISFLNGRRTPFVWHDSFIDSTHLRRTYFGWHIHQFKELQTSYSQPLPVYGTVEAIRHADEVLQTLPSLFGEFGLQADPMRLTWILNPLWGASQSVLDDQFALICISLERLAEAWQKKKASGKRPPFFSDSQRNAIREAICSALSKIWDGLGLNSDQKSVLSKKIENIWRLPTPISWPLFLLTWE